MTSSPQGFSSIAAAPPSPTPSSGKGEGWSVQQAKILLSIAGWRAISTRLPAPRSRPFAPVWGRMGGGWE